VSIAGTSNDFPWWLRSRASALCADAPSRNNGDPCDFETDACLPTRPVLNPDGTVMGHTYLRCVPQTSQCAPEEWPVIASYMEPCGAAVETQYGGPGINGVVVDTELVTACLLTWDEATQSVKSGFTRTCLGDWQCPLYSLCDAQIPELLPGGPATVAICKRGPRGMLTPDLLVP
jgi:hypothetical protein